MMNRKHSPSLLRTVVAIAAAGTLRAEASVLGTAEVNSHLGELLRITVVLDQVEPRDASRVRVTTEPGAGIGPETALGRMLATLQPAVLTDPLGRVVVELTSTRRITDPILSLTVHVRLPEQSLQRAYTLLVDPPAYAATHSQQPQPARQIYREPPASAASADTYGPVQPGETLGDIARRLSPRLGQAPQSVLTALHELNPAAFIHGDINLLKVGARLKMPGADGKLLAAKPAVPAAAAPTTVRAPQAVPQSPVPAKPVDTGELAELGSVHAQLAAAAGDGQLMQQHLQALNDELRALQARTAERDRQLADLEAQISARTTVSPATAASGSKPAAKAPVTAGTPATSVTGKPPQATGPAWLPAAPGALLPELSGLQTATGLSWPMLLGSGALATCLVAAGLLRRRRARPSNNQRPAQATATRHPATEAALLAAVAAKADQRLRIEQESDGTVVSMWRKRDDPRIEQVDSTSALSMNEAERLEALFQETNVLMAYGDHETAEHMLRAALASQPDNLDILTKLAEIYYHSHRAIDFLQLAQSLSERPGVRETAQWHHLVELGRERCPGEPLFGGPDTVAGYAADSAPARIYEFSRHR